MIFKLVFFIFGVIQILASDLTKEEYYYPDNDNGTLLVTSIFSKLNTILLENRELGKRQDYQANLMKELTENIALITNSMKTFLDRQDQQENLIKKHAEDTTSIKKYIHDPWDIKSLYSNCGWTVIQRRQDGSVDFNRNWTEYKRGFGDPNGEFFIGVEKLHALTTYGAPQELLIVLEDFNNETVYAKYDKFVIGNEVEQYAFKEIGKYSGDAGDRFSYQKGNKFSTPDHDNDGYPNDNCAKDYKAGWWYNQCFRCNLNGKYSKTEDRYGFQWDSWNYKHFKFVEMMIRPKT